MFYSIHHLTKFRYSAAVSESIMEVRMHPRSEGRQRCLQFQLHVTPRTTVNSYRDYLGNVVHHFDVPGHHRQLVITAEALVEVQPPPALPDKLGAGAWELLQDDIATHDFWEMLAPSTFARSSQALDAFSQRLSIESQQRARSRDLLQVLLQLNAEIYSALSYVPKSTRVDSPIEEALERRSGVCQDFAHIMLAVLRKLGIPSRYVSGYLFHSGNDGTRSAEGATHAWVEAWLPEIGWTGFDPTNNMLAGERHVRTAVGRDYADVPPSRGLFKGEAESELAVLVRVLPSDAPPAPEEEIHEEDWSVVLQDGAESDEAHAQQQQQQQQ